MSKIIHLMPRPRLYEFSSHHVEEPPGCPKKKIVLVEKLCRKAGKFELTDDEMNLCLTAEQHTTDTPEVVVNAYVRCLKVIIKKRKFKWLK